MNKLLYFSIIVFLGSLWEGCSVPKSILPEKVIYNSCLIPNEEFAEKGAYSIDEDGTMNYNLEGVKVAAKYLTDTELNEMFPEDSYRKEFSSNPFTYGNWVDPQLGYTPNRFTVFLVTAYNILLPKVELDPAKTVLLTDTGDEFRYYGVGLADAENNFELYYSPTKGWSGNERYIYEQRMGIVRAKLYRRDQKIFRDDKYSGFVVFDLLPEDVKSVEFTINDFIIGFDEADQPTRKVDITYKFDRKIEKKKAQRE
jgi:hypothetical protein